MKFETPSSGENEQGANLEREQNPELAEQLQELNQNAEMVGDQLENADPKKLGPEGISKVGEAIERVLGGVYMLAGAAAATEVWMALDDVSHQMDSMEKVLAAVVAATGIVVAVKGFDKLLNGSKKFWAELTPEQKTEMGA